MNETSKDEMTQAILDTASAATGTQRERLGLILADLHRRFGIGGERYWNDHRRRLEFAEALGALGDLDLAMSLFNQVEMCLPLLWATRSELAEEAARGERILAHAVTESTGGSDLAGLETEAAVSHGSLVLSGGKRWVLNGAHADTAVVLAVAEGRRPPFHLVLLAVDTDAPGVVVADEDPLAGYATAGTASIGFDGTPVAADRVLGGLGQALPVHARQFAGERILLGALMMSAASWMLDATAEHAGRRNVFGLELGKHQSVAFRLARLRTEIEGVRCLASDAVDRWADSGDPRELSSAVKLMAGRVVKSTARECLLLFGAAAQIETHPMNRMFYEALWLSVEAGSEELLAETIAKERKWI